jgi:hypothetical protein
LLIVKIKNMTIKRILILIIIEFIKLTNGLRGV